MGPQGKNNQPAPHFSQQPALRPGSRGGGGGGTPTGLPTPPHTCRCEGPVAHVVHPTFSVTLWESRALPVLDDARGALHPGRGTHRTGDSQDGPAPHRPDRLGSPKASPSLPVTCSYPAGRVPPTGVLGSQSEWSPEADRAPRFLSLQTPATPPLPPYTLPALYRTEDHLPVDAARAAPPTPRCRRRR